MYNLCFSHMDSLYFVNVGTLPAVTLLKLHLQSQKESHSDLNHFNNVHATQLFSLPGITTHCLYKKH